MIKCTDCEYYDADHTYINSRTGIKTKGGCARDKGCPYKLEDFDIVRCKDCKYWEVDTDVGFCTRTEECDWNTDDFCSRGEKKDE